MTKPVALVTGACGGIGQAIAQRLLSQGYCLALADVDTVALDRLTSQLQGAVGDDQKIQSFPGDLLNADYCSELPGRVHTTMGSLSALVNNAGLMRRGDITQASDEDFALSMSVNVEAPFRLVRSAIPLMAQSGGGAIVNIASCWGVHPGPDHLVYCTTKAALAAMTQCLGRDHARQNIRVNAVCPNEVNTPMLRTGFEIRGLDADSAVAQLNQSVPIGHIAEPSEIADVVGFLVSDQARYLCGSLIEVNGGKPVY